MSDDARMVLDVVIGSMAARWIVAGLQLILFKAFLEPAAVWVGKSKYRWIDRILGDRLPDM